MSLFPAVASAGHKLVFIDTETTGTGPTDVPVGVSYCLTDGKKGYLRWGHERGGNNCTLDEVRAWWDSEIAVGGVLVIFHNAVFDLRMMVAIGCRIPELVDDTCVIAALLNEHELSYTLEGLSVKHLGPQHVKASDDLNEYCRQVFGAKKGREASVYWRCPGDLVEPYAEQDANLTRLLYLCLRPKMDEQDLGKVHSLERALMPVLVRMYRAGVRVDVDKAEKLKDDLRLMHDDANEQLFHLNHGVELNTESTVQVAELLKSLGMKVPKTGTGRDSVTKEFLKTLTHPVAQLIMNKKRAKHYSNVFVDNYIFKNLTSFNFIHPSFHQARSAFGGARTGRFSSAGGLNAQNIPKRDKVWGPLIRGLFIPAYDGGQWLRSDYSQIEYRFFAHYAGGAVMRRYNDEPKVDFHEMVAQLTGLPREVAKNTNFGILFGMGERKMAVQTGLPPDEANEALRTYHELIPEAKILTARAASKAMARGYITTFGGRRCRFVKHEHGFYMNAHKALNYLTQGSAADLIKLAMIEVDRAINWTDTIMHLTVHDELDFSVEPGEDGVKEGRRIKEIMEGVAKLRVPVMAEAEIGADWGHCAPLP